jgi:hypothetical protein
MIGICWNCSGKEKKETIKNIPPTIKKRTLTMEPNIVITSITPMKKNKPAIIFITSFLN